MSTAIRLDRLDKKEPSTAERIYRRLFSFVRASHSGHQFGQQTSGAMTLEAADIELSISILSAVTIAVFGMRSPAKEPPLTLQQIGAWGTRIEKTLLATPDAQRDELANRLLADLNHAIKQSGRDLSIHPQRVLRAVRRYENAQ